MIKELKLGDKVKIPKTKQGASSEGSMAVKKAKKLNQDFLFFNGIVHGNVYVLWTTHSINSGDYFDLADLENERIIISESCLEKDIDTIKETILEHFVALKYTINDSKDLSEVLIKEILKIIQE